MLAPLLLLVATAGIVTAQEKLTVVSASLPPPILTTIRLPPAPPVCFADVTLATDTAADTSVVEEGADSRTFIPHVRRCEDGPVRKLLAPPNVFYWPPIYRRTCNNLFCKDPPCIARKTVWRTRCVLVYKFIRGCWRKIGFRTVRYLDHLKCECKQCSDIRDKKWCVKTTPCPSSKNKNSFCYWRPGPFPIGKRQVATADAIAIPLPFPVPISRCDCCTPYPCPFPKIFDNSTCSCVCPPGSKPVGNKCVGDCSDVSLNYCTRVACADNKHFNCQVKGYQCVCPSCPRATDHLWCKMTKCLEQPLRPKCVFQYNRCRCPTCADQKEREWCEATNCGANNQRVCRFDPYWKKCSCPYHVPLNLKLDRN